MTNLAATAFYNSYHKSTNPDKSLVIVVIYIKLISESETFRFTVISLTPTTLWMFNMYLLV